MEKVKLRHIGISVLFAAVGTLLLGCSSKASDEPSNKDAIISELKARLASKNTFTDPSSIQYRNVKFYQKLTELKDGKKVILQATICGEVNRNLDGGSSDFGRFLSLIGASHGGVINLEDKSGSTSMLENANVEDKAGYHAFFEKNYAEHCRNVSEKLN